MEVLFQNFLIIRSMYRCQVAQDLIFRVLWFIDIETLGLFSEWNEYLVYVFYLM